MYIKLPIPDAALHPKFTCAYLYMRILTLLLESPHSPGIAAPPVERELSDRENGSRNRSRIPAILRPCRVNYRDCPEE